MLPLSFAEPSFYFVISMFEQTDSSTLPDLTAVVEPLAAPLTLTDAFLLVPLLDEPESDFETPAVEPALEDPKKLISI